MSDNIAGMDAVTHPPYPVNEPNLTYAPGSASARSCCASSSGRSAGRSPCAPTSAAAAATAGVRRSRSSSRTTTSTCWGDEERHDPRRRGRRQGGSRRCPAVAADALRRAVRDHPQGCRPPGRPVAAAAQRRHHARPVQDGLPGRDRRGLRADRLLAVQRPLRAPDPTPSSRSRTAPAYGTAPTTGPWRASSTRSRRSTSPPSPATCRPRRR